MTQGESIKSFNSIFYLELVRQSPLYLLVTNTKNISLDPPVAIACKLSWNNIQWEAEIHQRDRKSKWAKGCKPFLIIILWLDWARSGWNGHRLDYNTWVGVFVTCKQRMQINNSHLGFWFFSFRFFLTINKPKNISLKCWFLTMCI